MVKKVSDISQRDNPLLTDAQSGGTTDVLADLQDAWFLFQKVVGGKDCPLLEDEKAFLVKMKKTHDNLADPYKAFQPTDRETKEIKRIRDKMMKE